MIPAGLNTRTLKVCTVVLVVTLVVFGVMWSLLLSFGIPLNATLLGALWASALAASVVCTASLWRIQIPERRWAEGKCAKCGYDLTGNESGVCLECGTRIKEETR